APASLRKVIYAFGIGAKHVDDASRVAQVTIDTTADDVGNRRGANEIAPLQAAGLQDDPPRVPSLAGEAEGNERPALERVGMCGQTEHCIRAKDHATSLGSSGLA